MALTIEKKAFLDLIQKTYPIVPAKSSLQILSNIRISFDSRTLELTATDLDHSIRASAPASGTEEFEVTVNGKKLFEVARELQDGELHLDVDEHVLTIDSAGDFQCKIAGADSRDFPAFPEVTPVTEFDISLSAFKQMVVKSSFAVSKDESRACLCGVLWEVDPERTGMVATDGHRLGYYFHNLSTPVEQKVSSIVSQKSLLHLIRMLSSEEEEPIVHVTLGEKYILFTDTSFSLCSKLIEGPYPDYQKVIPKNNPKNAIIDRVLLQDAVRRVSVLSNRKTHLVKFSYTADTLEITVLNRDIGGEARQVVPVQYDGEDHVIGFNAQYLAEILGIINTPSVRMEMNTQISACLIFPDGDEANKNGSEELFLIMPLRIMEEAV